MQTKKIRLKIECNNKFYFEIMIAGGHGNDHPNSEWISSRGILI